MAQRVARSTEPRVARSTDRLEIPGLGDAAKRLGQVPYTPRAKSHSKAALNKPNASSISGVNATTMQRNESSESVLRAALRTATPRTKEKVKRDTIVTPGVDLHRMKESIEEAGIQAKAVLSNHLAFVSEREVQAHSSTTRSTRSRDLTDASSKPAPTQAQSSAESQKGKGVQPQTEEGSDDEDGEGESLSMSRARKLARQLFAQIDTGKMEPQDVFAKVSPGPERVETKLDFFRERPELMLPPIEERFLLHDKQAGCMVLDISKLQHNPKSSTPRHRPTKAKQSLDDEDGTVSMAKASDPVIQGASATSLWTPSSTFSLVESVEQRAFRQTEGWQRRDRRIAAAKQKVQHCDLDRRLEHLERLRGKALRKELAERHRPVLTWLAVALSMKALDKILMCSAPSRKNRSDGRRHNEMGPGERARARWKKAKAFVVANLPVDAKDRLQMAVMLKRDVEFERRRRSKIAWKSWRRAVVVVGFVSKLRMRRRRTVSIHAVRQFLESAYKGIQLQLGVRTCLAQIKIIQKACNSAIKLRKDVRAYLYLPTLWELETKFLGEKLKATLPHGLAKTMIKNHREAWDPEGRIHEHLQELSRDRFLFGMRDPKDWLEREARRKRQAIERQQAQQKRRSTVRSDTGHVPWFTECGECVAPAFTTTKKPHQSIEAAVIVMQSYRLDPETRQQLCRSLFRNSVDRWYQNYQAYKIKKKEFLVRWQQYQVEINALGVAAKDQWPSPPLFPQFPYSLFTVDTKRMNTMMLNALRETEMGRNLFNVKAT
eukprot:TRINITY_DN28660_c0_g2_i1.p1 TRINITY_DN28660_c0_g2~~TRINITY_DN28660_c0_g2_i1.p1  ORF type:complete len:774 (-),score=140.25 TRINITY_DN28660_c0_g2_i1:93-2414(-)